MTVQGDSASNAGRRQDQHEEEVMYLTVPERPNAANNERVAKQLTSAFTKMSLDLKGGPSAGLQSQERTTAMTFTARWLPLLMESLSKWVVSQVLQEVWQGCHFSGCLGM
ncbi:uncharacterized protein PGTG_19671 [Puccinia graminis f. sp. tritici CRL 75-36-700-3]|uniref:Uncharacterized protein n=1 Tax=Puccinia graminis f. sp. tritici (strain CRL 75-36-700-3 / race SCCL) TaxID=418459 RepID=E3LAX7_PUCGT|nr:uncharacterized protein PGTG_19671 [Puccinia graminis f. sp. tritici CRL 75-36-700-3]EFP93702.1 hypothetical protein PGTG_19671 [Puccinia graminis f. sp. tritici CRL 75-36-700-3]